MNGKNIEKLVLANRLILGGVLLSVLVFTTVPNLHGNSHQTSGDSTIDALLTAANFTPEINVPIAGESKKNTKNQSNSEAANDGESKADASINDSSNDSNPHGSDSKNTNSEDVNLENTNSEQDASSNQATSNYYTNYYSGQPSNSTNSNSNSAPSSSASDATGTASSSSHSNTNTKSSTYVDENYEHIDSANPSPIPYIAPANHDDDNSTSDQPSRDLNPSTPSASTTTDPAETTQDF